MDEVTPADVIGVDHQQRRLRPPNRLAVAVLGLAVGAGLGIAWADWRERTGEVPAEEAVQREGVVRQPDGGVVYVCDGQARAFVFASGLPASYTEVHLPLRGDGALLPVLTGGADLFTGTARGHQTFEPQDGYLALAQQMGVPQGESVAAQVGEQRLELTVRGCGGGRR